MRFSSATAIPHDDAAAASAAERAEVRRIQLIFASILAAIEVNDHLSVKVFAEQI